MERKRVRTRRPRSSNQKSQRWDFTLRRFHLSPALGGKVNQQGAYFGLLAAVGKDFARAARTQRFFAQTVSKWSKLCRIFETKRPEGRKAYRKNPAHSIDVQHRRALTLQAMMAEADRSIMALDRSIEIELERTGIRDRSHYAYPMSAKAMETRRDNLKSTRDALAERLSCFEGKQLDSAAA
jgi:hypothetical protein